MRTIKFRAWDSDRKEMIYFDDFTVEDTKGFWKGDREVWRMSSHFGRGTCDGLGYFHDDFSEKSNVELMQFIGLHDKNGKEIFVGDVLQLKKLDGSLLYYKIFSVKGGFAFNTHQDDFPKPQSEIYFYESTSDMQNSGFISTLEIIGNLFENPELIK